MFRADKATSKGDRLTTATISAQKMADPERVKRMLSGQTHFIARSSLLEGLCLPGALFQLSLRLSTMLWVLSIVGKRRESQFFVKDSNYVLISFFFTPAQLKPVVAAVTSYFN